MVNRLINTKRKEIKAIDALKRSMVSSAVTHGLDLSAPMKFSGVKWLGDIPAHWQTIKLRQILHPFSVKNHPELPLLSVVREQGVIIRDVTDKEANHNYKAVRFDALMYGIELAYLVGKKYTKGRSDLLKKVSGIASVANIPEIMAQSELIQKILHTDYLDSAGINEFEYIREKLRNLLKYVTGGIDPVDTVILTDEILAIDWRESELESDDLKNYKAKAEFYIRQHQDEAVIAKLKGNVPLNESDIAALQKILWSEVGTKEDYEAEIGSKPLGEFVREIVGLDMRAAKEAFSVYLNDTSLDSRQIYFVNQIVEYIVHNGLMKDLSVLQESPFTDKGSVVEIFTDLTLWTRIRKTIEQVNANAVA